jgi:hypothetical protein
MSDTAVHEILTWICDHGWSLFLAFLFIAVLDLRLGPGLWKR